MIELHRGQEIKLLERTKTMTTDDEAGILLNLGGEILRT